MQRHQWRERSEEGLRIWRASYHSGDWSLSSQLKGEDDWTPQEPIQRAQWEMLRDVLWRKYQRKRCPWGLVEKIDQLLEKMGDEGDQ